MKKILSFLAAIIAAGLIYPTTMLVTDIDYTTDVVTIETATGFIYQFEGAEDYIKGDLVSCIMFSNGTADITDDMILSVRYSGFYIN